MQISDLAGAGQRDSAAFPNLQVGSLLFED